MKIVRFHINMNILLGKFSWQGEYAKPQKYQRVLILFIPEKNVIITTECKMTKFTTEIFWICISKSLSAIVMRGFIMLKNSQCFSIAHNLLTRFSYLLKVYGLIDCRKSPFGGFLLYLFLYSFISSY